MTSVRTARRGTKRRPSLDAAAVDLLPIRHGCSSTPRPAGADRLRARCLRALLAAVCLLALCTGCTVPWGATPPTTYENDAVRRLMDRLQDANAGLQGLKGTGRVTVSARGDERTFERTAWVGGAPGRLRFAFRAPTGMPIFSMSCDEQWVTALNHAEGDYYRRRIGDNSLSGFLPVQITCADLYGLLAGRPPGIAFDAVHTDPAAPETPQEITLLLKRRFRGTVGRLGVDRDTGDLRRVELLDVHGSRQYEARLDAIEEVDGYRLPGRIHLSGPDGWLILEAGRLWTQAAPDPSLFRIPPPPAD